VNCQFLRENGKAVRNSLSGVIIIVVNKFNQEILIKQTEQAGKFNKFISFRLLLSSVL
jgi:hypothetical protein